MSKAATHVSQDKKQHLAGSSIPSPVLTLGIPNSLHNFLGKNDTWHYILLLQLGQAHTQKTYIHINHIKGALSDFLTLPFPWSSNSSYPNAQANT